MLYKVLMKKKMFVLPREESGYEEAKFTFKFEDYDDVQNFIGYMVDGSESIEVQITKEDGNE